MKTYSLKMIDIVNSSIEEIRSRKKYDLFITAIGYENRASYLANMLNDLNFSKKICFNLVSEPNELEQKRLIKLGFKFVSTKELIEILTSDLESIIIDYSVMMKSLYASIIEHVSEFYDVTNRDIYFSYTHAKFEKALDNELYVKSTKPILLNDTKILNSSNRIKLIISLGYERLSAIGLIEYLQIDYKDVIVLINQVGQNHEHYEECMTWNKEFLSLLEPHQIMKINFFDFGQTTATLEAILYNLERKDEVAIIAPMSVKSFSFLSMITSLKYDNLRFYNVTSIVDKASYNKFPDEDRAPIVYKLVDFT